MIPCVRSIDFSFDCLPALIVIGAFKSGTTGIRHKLLASKQFISKGTEEGNFWGYLKKATARSHQDPIPLQEAASLAASYASTFGRITKEIVNPHQEDLLLSDGDRMSLEAEPAEYEHYY